MNRRACRYHAQGTTDITDQHRQHTHAHTLQTDRCQSLDPRPTLTWHRHRRCRRAIVPDPVAHQCQNRHRHSRRRRRRHQRRPSSASSSSMAWRERAPRHSSHRGGRTPDGTRPDSETCHADTSRHRHTQASTHTHIHSIIDWQTHGDHNVSHIRSQRQGFGASGQKIGILSGHIELLPNNVIHYPISHLSDCH